MIEIKMIPGAFEIDEPFLAHYGVSIKDGAPGRGSGRYEYGSGKDPRAPKRHNDTLQRGSKAKKKESGNTKRSGLFTGKKEEPWMYKPSVFTESAYKRDKSQHPEWFPYGKVGKDNRSVKAYRSDRDKHCKIDPKTGLHLRKPADGVSESEYAEYRKRCSKLYVPPDNIGEFDDDSRRMNCVSCVMSYDLWYRGYDCTAKAFKNPQYDACFRDAYKNIKTQEYYGTLKGTVRALDKQDVGARGCFAVDWRDGGGHAMAYEVKADADGVKYVMISNPQTGISVGTVRIKDDNLAFTGAMKRVSQGFREGTDKPFGIIRLDNAELNTENIAKYVD